MTPADVISLQKPWLHDEGWEYHLTPVSAAQAVPDYFRSFLELWESKRDGDAWPAWSDFDLMDFQGWWGWVSVFDEVPDDDHAFDVRLWGSKVAKAAHFELSAKRLHGSETTPDGVALHVTNSDILFMRNVLDQGRIGYCHGPIHLEVHVLGHYSMVALPLSANRDGIASVLTAARLEK